MKKINYDAIYSILLSTKEIADLSWSEINLLLELDKFTINNLSLGKEIPVEDLACILKFINKPLDLFLEGIKITPIDTQNLVIKNIKLKLKSNNITDAEKTVLKAALEQYKEN